MDNQQTTLTILNANAFEVEFESDKKAFVEDQEHCAILWREGECGGHAGQYYFLSTDVRFFDFCIWDHARVKEVVRCKILKYSHDYGETWGEVNYDTNN